MAEKDVEVKIDVLHPAAVIGLGVPLILTVGTEVTYKEYKGKGALEALVVDYPTNTTAYAKAKSVLAQKNKPDLVAVATYVAVTPEAGQSLLEVVQKYYGKPWHFALLADATATEAVPVSDFIEEKEFKFLVLQSANKAELAQFSTKPRTLVYYHPGKPNEHLDSAVIGDVASLTVGQATWKFRKNLVGITAVEDDSELDEIHALGANMYVEKAGVPQTSEGLACVGERTEYIDFYHGQDFVKADAETRLQSLLTDNDKIPSNDTGISMIASTFTTTLETAGQQGIVESNNEGYQYEVNTIPWDEVDEADREKRVYTGVTFSYSPQGAIHKIKVNGTVVAGA
ncbi:DUF3383 family protein [Peribacillus asahii]|uniref:DUF3383 family protein n=1 Tax=Peribacillus asahii TaxID=228899 RepID=UPI00207A17E1|nr:DUF3383 family protein [Peribacillus asahii]USK71762.1 DUF3383 domain-containing protein [Peribacillus asahii]